jgi:linoleoyl-CoA desaturase
MLATPKFNNTNNSFHAELKRRVNSYFDTLGKPQTGNTALLFKGLLLSVLFIATYVHLLFFTPYNFLAIIESVFLGGLIAAIGFNIMHDGAHGSFSNNALINKIAAFTLNVLGGSSYMWNMKHNVIHHAYTNIEGVDDDIDIQPWMRMTSGQKKYKMHKFQHLYFWVLYALLYIFWIFVLDYQKYFKQRIGAVAIKNMKFKDHLTFWSFKVIHLFLFVALPIYKVGFLYWFISFIIFTLVAGFVLSMVFQLAHTVEHTHFPVVDPNNNKLADEWAIHQLKTTANFATKNKLISWLVGGLNFQIEHHLFPKISHVHYPKISKIIKEACADFNIQYIEYKKVRNAVWSHVLFLKQMGNAF